MSRNAKFALAGLVVFLVACGLTIFFVAYEKVEVEVREPPSGEARRNPYLALERLLNRFDHDAQTVRKIASPDLDTTTIVLGDPDYDFSPEQVDAWTLWVRNGGHLVLPQPLGEADEDTAPLLAELGFEPGEKLESDEEEKEKESEEEKEKESEEEKEKESALAEVLDDVEQRRFDWPEEAEREQFAVDADSLTARTLFWGAEDVDWLAVDDDETAEVFAASKPVDGGRVTLLRSSAILTNNSIGADEHATFAVELAALSTPLARDWSSVTIVMFGQRQSWMMYVLGYTWPFFAVVLVALLLAIRAGRNRFGPMLADPPPERRSRREHIDAVGRFLWQQGSVATLVEAAQEALMAELEHRNPRLAHAEDFERDMLVAEELDITVDEVRKLFRKPSGSRDAQLFIKRIRQLEQHRRNL